MAELTALVPAYRAASFIAETLDSLVAQTFSDLRILISIDGADPATEAVCRRYLDDQRVELVVQPERLGWVGNVNALLARVDTPCFFLMPHDDVVAPAYAARLMTALREDRDAVCAYSDITGFGSRALHIAQLDLTGTLFDRTIEFLLHRFPAVAFRGIVVRSRLRSVPLLRTTLRADFAADTVWMLDLALDGTLRRIAEPLYAKRYAPTSVHATWFEAPRQEIVARWVRHAVICTQAALSRIDDSNERTIVTAAGFLRAVGAGGAQDEVLSPRDDSEAVMAGAQYCSSLDTTLDVLTRALAHPQGEALVATVRHPVRRRTHPLIETLRRVIQR